MLMYSLEPEAEKYWHDVALGVVLLASEPYKSTSPEYMLTITCKRTHSGG